ncbi:fatty acid-binding protein, adipocyte-like [Zootermopsis nevadensis]|uniref:fatty acid-binding protein, adipocyte-like n=1 Tax=Zootermopsis nevadensis TaxID=136037 RepID=UPI000B8EB78F|nr:fatty acid-binding protein, adipocyte-like [Zootermopsis nevadensis]XP_021938044.1 fatty acid-binding protein, adipocyte-like [Zootermopsis nevadensis]XP_021938045.1 fatty acid-binding protein, adipocyte-like [Zootermopsis nevadensis]XP_021938046.1 fatty acid-binding protein, adipocyte-like [Zootermopsis nevadensis]
MVKITGKYQLEKNENLDGYFKAIGVPYVARKMMAASTPVVEISCKDEIWTVKTSTLIRTTVLNFKVGEEYDEVMPSGEVLKNTTTLEDDELRTISKIPDGSQTSRSYSFSDTGMLLTLTHEKSGQTAKRHFKRLAD